MIKRIFLLLFSMVFLLNAEAQELSKLRISGRAERPEGVLADREIRDKNGKVCSVIIVITDLTSALTFRSSNDPFRIDSDPSTPGRYIVFLSPGEQTLEVYCAGYERIKIILNEQGIITNSGEVWQIKITGDRRLTDVIPVNVITEPKGAEVFIDNVSKGTGTTFETSAGEHLLRVELKGYKSTESKVTVSMNKTLFNYKLVSIDPIVVTINSEPSGAKILIDAMEKGETDRQLFLFPGNYSLRLQKSGYLDINGKMEVKETSENKFSFNLKKNTGYLTIETDPQDAGVLVNKEKYSSFTRIELAPGTYKIEVAKQYYYPKEEVVMLELGQSITKKFTLLPRVGSLQFSIEPSKAKVVLERDGREAERWQGLKLFKNLPEGTYQIKAMADGFKSLVKEIEITENKNAIIDLKMEEGSDHCSPITYSGKTYHTVKIGTQCWLKENLDIGTMIDVKQDAGDNGRIEKYCYDNNSSNCAKYGGLYQWDEAMAYSTTPGTKGICPNGWHIPTKAELETLASSADNFRDALLEAGQLTGTNTTGFSALLAGNRDGYGYFGNLAYNTYYWCSTVYDAASAYYMYLNGNDSNIYRGYSSRSYGFSVRCVED
ncbi:MAG: FISUMP domain-containing protein [Ignavibacteria bacterium]